MLLLLLFPSIRTQSCGLCGGGTPHVSNECPDLAENCAETAEQYCWQDHIAESCCLSCGMGEFLN